MPDKAAKKEKEKKAFCPNVSFSSPETLVLPVFTFVGIGIYADTAILYYKSDVWFFLSVFLLKELEQNAIERSASISASTASAHKQHQRISSISASATAVQHHVWCVSTFIASQPSMNHHLWSITSCTASPNAVHHHLQCITTPPSVHHESDAPLIHLPSS